LSRPHFSNTHLNQRLPGLGRRSSQAGLTPADLEAAFGRYVAEALRLRGVYGGRIALALGFESELIHDGTLAEIDALWARYPALDYMVGSVHHVGGTPIDFSRELFERAVAEHGGHQALFAAYYDAQYALLQHARPAVVGHFDLIKMYCPEVPYGDDVRRRIARNIQAIAAYGGLVELNSRAFKKGLPTPYPQPDVLQVRCQERRGRRAEAAPSNLMEGGTPRCADRIGFCRQ